MRSYCVFTAQCWGPAFPKFKLLSLLHFVGGPFTLRPCCEHSVKGVIYNSLTTRVGQRTQPVCGGSSYSLTILCFGGDMGQGNSHILIFWDKHLLETLSNVCSNITQSTHVHSLRMTQPFLCTCDKKDMESGSH